MDAIEVVVKAYRCPADTFKCAHSLPKGRNACHGKDCDNPLWAHKKCKEVYKAKNKFFAEKNCCLAHPANIPALEQHVKRSALQGGHVRSKPLALYNPCFLNQ